MQRNLSFFFILSITATFAVAALAQQKAKHDNVEGQIRLTSFNYFLATVFGDSEEYFKVARMPLSLLKDGAISNRDEKASRVFLTQLAVRAKAKNFSDQDKSQ